VIRFSSLGFICVLVLALSSHVSSDTDAAGSPLQKVVAIGDSSPAGGTFLQINHVHLEDNGSVTFEGCSDGCAQGSIFRYNAEERDVLISTGDPAPGGGSLDGVTCSGGRPQFGAVGPTNDGAVAFLSMVNNRSTTTNCIWDRLGAYRVTPGGGATKIAETGDTPDGTEISAVLSLGAFSSNGLGSLLACGANCTDHAVYLIGGSVVTRLYTANDELWEGARLDGLSGTPIGTDNAGGVLATHRVLEDMGSKSCIIVSRSGNAHTRVGCVGDLLPDGQGLQEIRLVNFNASGHTVFGSSDDGVYLWDGATKTVATHGAPTPLGGTFHQFFGSPYLNDWGHVLFTAQVALPTGGIAYGVFLYSDGTTQALYQAGVDVDSSCVFGLDINNRGQVLVGTCENNGGSAYYIGSYRLPPTPTHTVTPTSTPTATSTPPPTPTATVPARARQGRDIVLVLGNNSRAACHGWNVWLPGFLASSEAQFVRSRVSIGKVLRFNYKGGDYTCDFGPLPTYDGADTCYGIAQAAGRLKELIDSKATNKVTVIGHSQGGVIAAYLVANDKEWAKKRIASIVTFDSPLRGAPDQNLRGLALLGACSFSDPSIQDMRRNARVIASLQNAASIVPLYTLDATQTDRIPGTEIPNGFIEVVPRDYTSLDKSRPFLQINSCKGQRRNSTTCEPPRPIDDDHSSAWERRYDENGQDKAILLGCAIVALADCSFVRSN